MCFTFLVDFRSNGGGVKGESGGIGVIRESFVVGYGRGI